MMDDLVWPGKQHKPPTGSPNNFHLKIVTLQEPPFVIYKELSSDGNCSKNSILVQIHPETNNMYTSFCILSEFEILLNEF